MIKIICVGKLKEKYLKDAVEDYLTRINKYHKIVLFEVPDSNILKEGNEILKYIDKKDYIISMAIEGRNLNSQEFSEKIDKIFIEYPNITFIIGGSLGIRDDIKNNSNLNLSFSSMTFPHGLFRTILLEQIYRAFKIINNETYHK